MIYEFTEMFINNYFCEQEEIEAILNMQESLNFLKMITINGKKILAKV